MRRNQIIFAVVLLLVLASFGGVYQFYFAEKLAQYQKDLQFRKDLEAAAKDISDFFSGTDPETVISRWRNEVQPWAETLQQRAAYFDDAKWYEHELPPETGRIPRVWYGEQLDKMQQQLYNDIAEKAPNIYPFPENIFSALDVKTEADMAQEKEVTNALMNQQLGRLAFGMRFINLLLDEKILGLHDISVWPRRQDPKHKGQLALQTVGVDVDIYMRHLIHLLEVLRRQNRYFHVDAIHVTNSNIASQGDPVMRVRMLITQAKFIGKLDAPGTAGSAKSLYDMTTPKAAPKPPPAKPAEPTGFGKLWRWFKRNILYMNA
jgi:hypothetical protein